MKIGHVGAKNTNNNNFKRKKVKIIHSRSKEQKGVNMI